MKTIRDLTSMRACTRAWKSAGQSIGVVPTMGALHPGHLSLVSAAKSTVDRVIVTLFVNPKQFNNPEDLANYPRSETSDASLLASAGVDVLFAPDAATVYPTGFATKVSVAGLSEVLCGAYRPGHFDGVATVVPKLLLMTGADIGFFGEKDWQQLQIIRRVVADLNIPLSITGCPTLRDLDGLAMSSRNMRLSKADRTRAPALHQAMLTAAHNMSNGVTVDKALSEAKANILQAGFSEVEYLELRDAGSLALQDRARPFSRLFGAAWIGGVRLIDNIPV